MLDSVGELLELHLNAEKLKFMYQDDVKPPSYIDSISPSGLDLLQKKATPWLVSLLNKPPPMDSTLKEEFLDRISNLMSSLCGKVAHGPRF
jgi:hypothetical protein